MTRTTIPVILAVLFACQSKSDPDSTPDGGTTDGGGEPISDQDGDGYINWEAGGDDCDDLDPTVHPGAVEVWYDGVNQDCGWGSDYDADGDQDDHVDFGGADCDDTEFWIGSNALELCTDLIDNDCDGTVDEAPCGRTVGEADGAWLGTEHRYLGYAMETNCDVDGDGVMEVLVTGPRAATEDMEEGPQDVAGVHMLSRGDELDPTDGLVVRRERTKVAFGTGLDCHGDLDGDGYLDLAVTSFDEGDKNTGVSYVFLGPLSGEVDAASADLTIMGEWRSSTDVESFGAAIRVVDLIGEGHADLIVGERGSASYWEAGDGTADSEGLRLFMNMAPSGTIAGWSDSARIEADGSGRHEVSDFDGDGLLELVTISAHSKLSPYRCSLVYSGADMAALEPGGSLENEDALVTLRCDDGRGKGVFGGLPFVADLDDDGYQDVLVGSYGGAYAFQGDSDLGSEMYPDAVILELFCYDYTSGFTDIAFDRDVDGVLTTALAMGRAPGCPFTEDNNNRGRVAFMRGWAWATYTLEDAEAWIASDESTDGIDRSGQGTGRRVDFSHEASTGTRLWFAEPNFHPSGDTFGRVMAFDLDTFGL